MAEGVYERNIRTACFPIYKVYINFAVMLKLPCNHQAGWCMWRRKWSVGDFVDETWQRDYSETGREDFGDLKRIEY